MHTQVIPSCSRCKLPANEIGRNAAARKIADEEKSLVISSSFQDNNNIKMYENKTPAQGIRSKLMFFVFFIRLCPLFRLSSLVSEFPH